jgi:uncharacterized protein (DUF4415 family)
MSKTDTRIVLDFDNLPPLTDKQKAQIEKLKAKKDEDIDLSDIPELTEDFWKNAKRGHFYRVRKESTTVRLDADILAWLKSEGPGYQTRLNAILRQVMLKELKR